jgi:hypothetical protein
MLPVKFKGVYQPHRFIQTLLRQLGLPRTVWGVRNFWEHHYGRLDIILYDAAILYKKHARQVHPRRLTDGEEDAKKLNSLWQEVQRRFDQHMNPRLVFASRKHDATARPHVPPGHYMRVCPYKHCKRVFITKHRWKIYCDPRHRAAVNYRNWWVRSRSPRRILRKCKNPHCAQLFWTKNHRKTFHSKKCMMRFHLRKYRERNKEAEVARLKKWRQDNQEKMRAYYQRPEVRERKNRQRQEFDARQKLKKLSAANSTPAETCKNVKINC